MNIKPRHIGAAAVVLTALGSGCKEEAPKPLEIDATMMSKATFDAYTEVLADAGIDVKTMKLTDDTAPRVADEGKAALDELQPVLETAVSLACMNYGSFTQRKDGEGDMKLSPEQSNLWLQCKANPRLLVTGDFDQVFAIGNGSLEGVSFVDFKHKDATGKELKTLVVEKQFLKGRGLQELGEMLINDGYYHLTYPTHESHTGFTVEEEGMGHENALATFNHYLEPSLRTAWVASQNEKVETPAYRSVEHIGRLGVGNTSWVEWDLGSMDLRNTRHDFKYTAKFRAADGRVEEAEQHDFSVIINSEGGKNVVAPANHDSYRGLAESGIAPDYYPIGVSFGENSLDFMSAYIDDDKAYLLHFDPLLGGSTVIKGKTVGSIEGWYPSEWNADGPTKVARLDDPDTEISMTDFIKGRHWLRH